MRSSDRAKARACRRANGRSQSWPRALAALGRFGKREDDEQAAEILAFVQPDLAAINFRDVADDGEAKARAWLPGRIEPLTAREQFLALGLGDAPCSR